MRLDKFLKVSRIIKRRTVAKEVSDRGKVLINNRTAKASSEVTPGDILEIDFGQRKVRVEVLNVTETVRAQDAKELYKLLD
ncbi:MAG: RNA-binding S4 domain-containing protein [Carboxydocellales bacterium]